ncbi:MAG: hypothetical protein WBP45_05820 [Daejeonella sp.]
MFYTDSSFGIKTAIFIALQYKLIAMSREILDFSNLIDEQFDFTEGPANGFIRFIFGLFR